MAELIPMLALSPTMEQATIVKWNKNEGDDVAAGQVLCEVETDKAVMEYEAAGEGKLLKILVGQGESCGVGDPIAIIGREGEDIEALLAQARQKKAAAGQKPPTEQKPPAGEKLPPGEKPPAAAEAQASQPELTAGGAPAGEPIPAEARKPAPSAAAPPAGRPGGRVAASPLARKLAEQAGLDLAAIRGSGPGGRVVQRDIEQAMAQAAPQAAPARAGAVMPAAAAMAEQVIPVSPMRRAIAQRLSQSMSAAPHYYVTVSVGMDALLAARRRLNESRGQGQGNKVSLNAFLIKFAAEALARHPRVNSSWEGQSIRQHGRADIALAVALADGLVAPVVRDCTNKGLLAIDGELAGLVARAQAGQLRGQEMEGATFTISNLGNYGIEQFTAVINPPGSAILAVGQIAKAAVLDEQDELTVQSVMKLTLSCDHRVIDGAVGAAFLAELKNLLANPVQQVLVVQV